MCGRRGWESWMHESLYAAPCNNGTVMVSVEHAMTVSLKGQCCGHTTDDLAWCSC